MILEGDGTVGASSVVKAEPVYLRWADYRRSINWDLPGSAAWGYHRGVYPPVESDRLVGRVIRVPPGQASYRHSVSGDYILVQLRGETLIQTLSTAYALQPCDLMVIPRDTPYRYLNGGLTDALFLNTWAKPEPGEHMTVRTFVQEGETPPITPENPPSEWRYEIENVAAPSLASREPTHSAWIDYRRSINWRLARSEEWGFHRGKFPDVEASGVAAHVVRVPAGQASPMHSVGVDLIFVLLRGEIDFTIESRIYPTSQFDIVMIPAGANYAYMNVGFEDALCVDIWAPLRPGDKAKEAKYVLGKSS